MRGLPLGLGRAAAAVQSDAPPWVGPLGSYAPARPPDCVESVWIGEGRGVRDVRRAGSRGRRRGFWHVAGRAPRLCCALALGACQTPRAASWSRPPLTPGIKDRH